MSLPLAKVVDLMPDTVCVVDAQGHYLYVSAACERLLGYRQNELVGKRVIDFIHPDDRARTLAAIDHIMAGGAQENFENRYIHKAGHVVYISWSARWLAQDGIRLAVARDVTELKYAEQKQHALYQISEAAQTSDSMAALLQRIRRIIAPLLPADNLYVALYDAEKQSISYPCFFNERQPAPEPHPLDPDTRLGHVLDKGVVLATEVNRLPNAPLRGKNNWLGVPLTFRPQVVGALVVNTYRDNEHYTTQDLEFLQFVSTQIAVAINRKQNEQRLQRLATYDSLTDLPNRTLFIERFNRALTRAEREGEALTLLYLDLNGFKSINDQHGHDVGDWVLQQVAQCLCQSIRASDTAGRMGGDEFTVLLANVSNNTDIHIITHKIYTAIAEPLSYRGEHLQVSASIGVASYPQDGRTREQIFCCADAKMFAHKRGLATKNH